MEINAPMVQFMADAPKERHNKFPPGKIRKHPKFIEACPNAASGRITKAPYHFWVSLEMWAPAPSC